MIVDLVALAEAVDDAPGKARRIFRRMDVLLEDDELVAAETGDEVLRPQHFAQAIRHGTEQLVAAGMAEGVVDLLELIEVDEQQRRHMVAAMLGRQQAADLVAEIDAVGQRREFVIAGQVADAGLRIAPLGDVLEQYHGAAAGHRLERPRHVAAARRIRIGRDHVAGLGVVDLGQDHLAARRRNRTGYDAGIDDVGRAGAALHEIVGQVHHLAEAVVHHRKAAVGAEHAQAMRHVVERGVELPGERGFAEARGQRLDENRVQAEVDAFQAEEEQHQQDGEADIVEAAMQDERHRHRAAGKKDMELHQLRPAVIARCGASGVGDGHRDAQHVGDHIVVADDGEEAPGAEHAGVNDGADRVARLEVPRLLVRQHLGAPLVFAHLQSTQRADADDRRSDGPQQLVAGLHRGEHGGDRGAERAEHHGPEILAHRIDQCGIEHRLQLPLTASFLLVDQLHCRRARPVWSEVLPTADEVFLREKG